MSHSSSSNPPADGSAPQHPDLKIRGGPHKISGIQKSAQEASDERERFIKEQGGEKPTAGGEAEGQSEQPHHTGPRIRGGPGKILGVKQSAELAQQRREEHARQQEAVGGEGYKQGGDC